MADVLDHGEIVRDEEVGEPHLVLQIEHQVETCAWIETSSADTGSSPTIRFGCERKRAGDADALALAAENWCG